MNKKITIIYLLFFLIGISLIIVNSILVANYIDLGFNIEKTQLMVNNIKTTMLTIGLILVISGSIGYFLEKYR